MAAITPNPTRRSPTTAPTTAHPPLPLHRVAALLAAANAVLYGLIASGVLSVGRAEQGELGILGAGGVVYLVLAGVLWLLPRPVVWAGATVMQLMVIAMYLAIAPERDPSFELWGISLRVLQVAMIVVLVMLLVRRLRGRGRAG